MHRIRSALTVALALAGAVLAPAGAGAQITLDGSLGAAATLKGPSFVIPSTAGQVRGNNLFHSFGRFNVLTGESATFTGPGSIANIVSRVTGGESSTIDGLLSTRAAMPSANFFLLNPSGVIVGPNAVLDVGGAVHLTTAGYVRFGNGDLFCAAACPEGQSTVLSVSHPTAFGFLGPPNAAVTVDRTGGEPLQMQPGGALSLVGGEVRVTSASLSAPGGRISVASVASAGEITIPDLAASAGTTLGPVTVSGSTLDVSGDPGGTVRIRAGRLVIETSTMTAATLGDVDGARVGIDLASTGSLAIGNGSFVSTTALGAGRGGDIRIEGADVAVTTASSIGTLTLGSGAGGNVSLAGSASIGVSDSSLVFSEADATGPGGRVTISAPSVTLDTGGTISSTTLFDVGRGGDVTVDATRLSLTNAAAINATTSSPARGGTVTVTATESALVSGPGTAIASGSFGDGTPGDVIVQAGSLALTDGALLQAGVFAGTQGSNLTVTATGPITIANGSGMSSQAFFDNVGRVTLAAPSLTVDNGFISTSTLQSGRAGDIGIDVGTLRLTNGGQIASSSIFLATGSAGHITVNASDAITISGRSPSGTPVLPSPFGDFINDIRSGIFSTAAGSGRGGNITLRAPGIYLLDGGAISAASTGTASALAGNIDIGFGGTLRMDNATITTDSLLADGGNISITSSGSLLELIGSQITTSVRSGLGSGGNITLGSAGHPLEFLVLNDSGIHADAFGGPGGNIGIFGDVFLTSTPVESAITASSALSTPGTISIEATITDVSGSVARLPEAFLEAASLLRASCASRLAAAKASSLVIAGREGVPLEPGGLLPSPLDWPSAAAASPFEPPASPGVTALSMSPADPRCGR